MLYCYLLKKEFQHERRSVPEDNGRELFRSRSADQHHSTAHVRRQPQLRQGESETSRLLDRQRWQRAKLFGHSSSSCM